MGETHGWKRIRPPALEEKESEPIKCLRLPYHQSHKNRSLSFVQVFIKAVGIRDYFVPRIYHESPGCYDRLHNAMICLTKLQAAIH